MKLQNRSIRVQLQSNRQSIKGYTLDALARKYLWDVGLSYAHGRGHGMGAYLLLVHWSWKILESSLACITSNELGYYEDEKFGIRLKNVELVVKANTKYRRLNRDFLKFETVTMLPYQAKLFNVSMLTDDEVIGISSCSRNVTDRKMLDTSEDIPY